ncbi:MAG TPA: L,D-transpeptidase [Gemmatimonadaceae bacterium]|nr:L,D-transpeptidase [Gemmatimonadaceae bacterium]
MQHGTSSRYHDSVSSLEPMLRALLVSLVLAWTALFPVEGFAQGACVADPAKANGRPAVLGQRAVADTLPSVRVVISISARRLWVIDGDDTLRTADVAVGSGRTLRSGAKSWTFTTPVGVATVTAKEIAPVWIAPDWHYIEVAREKGLALRRLEFGRSVRLRNGLLLTMRGGAAGLVGPDSIFQALPETEEIVFDGALFVPPLGSRNRQVENVLGPYRLVLSNGVGLHGTPYKESIGTAATHGCIRLHDEDITWLYEHVPTGARVVIF